jgi:hypothetical protein
MAARTATEQIIDLRYTLRMMGIPIDGPSWMFGDNQSVITSSTIPESMKQTPIVRECIAANIIYFIHVEVKYNPGDHHTKILSWTNFWPLIQPLLFWQGDTLLQDRPLPLVIKDVKNNCHDPITGLMGVSDDVNPTIGSRSTNPRQTATAQRENQTTIKPTIRVTFQLPPA